MTNAEKAQSCEPGFYRVHYTWVSKIGRHKFTEIVRLHNSCANVNAVSTHVTQFSKETGEVIGNDLIEDFMRDKEHLRWTRLQMLRCHS